MKQQLQDEDVGTRDVVLSHQQQVHDASYRIYSAVTKSSLLTSKKEDNNNNNNKMLSLGSSWFCRVLMIATCVVAGCGGAYYCAFYQQHRSTRFSSNNNSLIIRNKDFVGKNENGFVQHATSTRFLEEENNVNFTISYGDDDVTLAESLSSSVEDESDAVGGNQKPLFPLTSSDYYGFLFVVIGLMIAAGGGIGGGGMLVPIYMLVMGFAPKQAIPLSNVTIVGGAIANTFLNVRKRHPLADRPLIDYDLTLVMIPLTLLGALIGAFLNKILPELLLTALLVLLLSFIAWATLKKAISMYQKETRDMAAVNPSELSKLAEVNATETKGDNKSNSNNYQSVMEAQETPVTNSALETFLEEERHTPVFNLVLLIATFIMVLAVNLLKGGGGFKSPLGIECGSTSFWMVNLFLAVWITALAIYIRHYLLQRHKQKAACGYQYVAGDIQWCDKTTIFIPLVCCCAGFCSGMFGIGGGMIIGPLILALGVHPQVNQACSAFMILFSALTATTSFIVFGLLIPDYAVLCFIVGFVATFAGHVGLENIMKQSNRNSYIAFSIGLVVLISVCLLTFDFVSALLSGENHNHSSGICAKS